jgi:hypothetical protein
MQSQNMAVSLPFFILLKFIAKIILELSSCHDIDIAFIKKTARQILSMTPIEYLKNVELRGSLFEDNHDSTSTGTVSCAYSEFFVDHTEPLEAMKVFKQKGDWVLGDLLEGHEFLVIVPITT